MKRTIDLQNAVWSARLLTPATWPDFERMFAKHKGCSGGCWCVFHICPSGEFNRLGRDGRKERHHAMLEAGRTSGVICYLDEIPVGWCQFGPAESFEQINRGKAYRQYRESDDVQPDWRITCVFVDKDYRRLGLARKVLSEAMTAIANQGGGIVEAYPMEVPGVARPQYTGSVAMYEREGFENISPLGKNHFLMRKIL
jgi:GNAT superfamily N-acetyltransferase